MKHVCTKWSRKITNIGGINLSIDQQTNLSIDLLDSRIAEQSSDVNDFLESVLSEMVLSNRSIPVRPLQVVTTFAVELEQTNTPLVSMFLY